MSDVISSSFDSGRRIDLDRPLTSLLPPSHHAHLPLFDDRLDFDLTRDSQQQQQQPPHHQPWCKSLTSRRDTAASGGSIDGRPLSATEQHARAPQQGRHQGHGGHRVDDHLLPATRRLADDRPPPHIVDLSFRSANGRST